MSPLGAAGNFADAVAVYLTAKNTAQQLARLADLDSCPCPNPPSMSPAFCGSHQNVSNLVGIGGALTDASAETFYKLPKDKQQELLQAYFDPQKGIGYTLGRTHINSCDFSSESYTYVKEGDKDLASFNIAHDLKYRVPFIKEALAAAGKDFYAVCQPLESARLDEEQP